MNFTREPIIETVITPKDGCKLVVRSSKGVSQEEYYVEAVEVVSFGHALFFRSTERSNSFLVPVTDYEIVELKEVRMPLKNVPAERSVKIGGGRETPVRTQPRESAEEGGTSEGVSSEVGAVPAQESQQKRDRRRRRRRGGGGHSSEMQRPEVSRLEEVSESEDTLIASEVEGVEKSEEEPAPSFISKLFPPPPTLIRETIGRYKPIEEDTVIESVPPAFPEDLEPPISDPKPKTDEETSIDES